jgi:hypothetical protein
MFARKGVFSSIGRAATLATVAAVALTAIEPMAYAASVLQRQLPLPASSAPASRSPRRRTVATITTPTATTAAVRSITAAVRIMVTTAAIGRACRIIADTPTPAGN